MTLTDGIDMQKTERMQLLKQRARTVLAQSAVNTEEAPTTNLQAIQLMEDLRIYQVELELQNDELRAAQQVAEVMRKRYESLFAQMPLPALVVDRQGVVDACNERADALLGSRNQLVSQDGRLWQKLNSQDRTRLHVALRDVHAGEARVLHQVTLPDPGLPDVVYDLHLIGLSIDYKLDDRVLMLLVDRTAEKAREQDQLFYSRLLDASDALIYAFDMQGKNLLANQALLNFVDRRRDDVLGHKRESFLPLRDAILHTEADQKVLHSGQPLTLEEQAHQVHPPGKVAFLTRKFPLIDLAGNIYGVGGISTDITALKEQHHQALLSETVFMCSQDAIIITDALTHIVRVNPAFTRQTGFSSAAVLGCKTSMLKSGRQDGAFYRAMWQALSTQGHWSGEINNRRADGSYYTIVGNINVVRDDAGRVLHYIAVQTDVTQLHTVQMRLEHQASFDSLTELPNRNLFNDRITQMLASARRHSVVFALLFIDLDRFKEVNDTLGHQVGDALLRTVAQRLKLNVRLEDTVARVGGDEFVVLLPGTDRAGAMAVAGNLLAKLREPVTLETTLPYRPMASLGLAMFPEDGNEPDLLLRNADMAMYSAKLNGRNRVASYTRQMSQANDHSFTIQNELADAIKTQQLRVYFQPKCQLDTGQLMGAEALVRWERPGHGLVMPAEFIRVAGQSGLLVALDQWVMNEALRQLGVWLRAGLWKAPWKLAVNQNVADLQCLDMTAQLHQSLHLHQVPAELLELEIIEDALLQHTPAQLARLGDLRNMGVSLAIDDFGTGYSSLSYLRQLPVSVIKIDLSFVRSMLLNENDAVLVRTIVDLAHNLGLTLVAEGIEEPAQLARLAKLGCELGQGYLFGKAVSAEEFAARWLNESPTNG